MCNLHHMLENTRKHILTVTKIHYYVPMSSFIEIYAKIYTCTTFSIQISCLICLPPHLVNRSWEFRQTQLNICYETRTTREINLCKILLSVCLLFYLIIEALQN